MSHLNSLVATALFLLSPLACTHGQEDWTKIDSDGDGYSVAEDCDDQNSAIYPDAQEVCDKRDNDCDGTIDEEASDAPVFYADVDGDGFGSPEDTLFSCSLPEGYTSDNNDCDDTRADVNPDADEVCDPDNTDEDCNGLADNDDDGRAEEGQTLYYIDSDQDSYGDVNDDGKGFCDNPSTETDPYSLNNEDCDDTSPLVHPGATEIWHNGLDDDCDGELDIDNLTQADARLSGVKSNDWAGLSVAVAGDVNGDGYDDVLVGGGNPFTSSGATHLVLGSSTGISDMSLADADAVFTGQRLGDYAGSSVSGAGDINADGFDDIIIGAYRDDSAGPDAGAAFIVLGRESGLPSSSLADADAILTGERAGDYAGYSVSAAGDVNGDGFDDVLVGARHESSSDKQAGSVYLINGSTDGPTTMNLSDATAKFTGESTYDLAHKVSTAGDVNGDGFADIMVGALQEGAGADAAGAVYVILGSEEASSNMSLQDADSKLNGTTKFDNVGVSVACAGDVNADGYDDLIIGAVGDDSAVVRAGDRDRGRRREARRVRHLRGARWRVQGRARLALIPT